jgi:hypothetical protein
VIELGYFLYYFKELRQMGWCIDFKLIRIDGTRAKYQYGQCKHELDGIVEVDVVKLISGELPGSTPMSEVARVLKSCEGENGTERFAMQVFTAVHRYYNKKGAYPEKGGYYA